MKHVFHFKGFADMFKVIGENKYARRAFYFTLLSAVSLMLLYRLPEIMTAFSLFVQ